MSWINGTRGSLDRAPYSVAKAALEMTSKLAAMELAMRHTGVRVKCIAPDMVDAPPALARTCGCMDEVQAAAEQLISLGSIMDPKDFASLCMYLVSDAATSMLGSVVATDGGIDAGAYGINPGFSDN